MCDCGNVSVVAGGNLVKGHTKSCGCYQREITGIVKSKNLTVEISGVRFGEALVIKRAHKIGRNYSWECLCMNCGSITYVLKRSLTSSNDRKCNQCYRSFHSEKIQIHGHARTNNVTPTFVSWSAMKTRCLNKNSHAYSQYGGRGISICDRWLNGDGVLNGFQCFLLDMGERPEGKTIDRFPNKRGNYDPQNCRWATPVQQMRNRVDNVMLKFHGALLPLVEVAELMGVSSKSLRRKVESGIVERFWT